MGGAICHFLGTSDSKDGICSICNKICPTKDKGEKAEEIKLSDEEKEIILASWKKFMENGQENGMEVFLTFINKHSKYKRDFGIDKFDDDEIKTDDRMIKHVQFLILFIKELVDYMDDFSRVQSTITDIANYYKGMNISPVAMTDYKDCLINYMLDNKIITKEGVKAWHHYTDKLMEGIKKVPKQAKIETSEHPSTS